MSKIRIGQIGIGHNHAEGKMLSVRKFPELFEVVGYSERDPAWLEKRGGYWIVISTLAGTETNLPLRPLLTKGLHITGSMLRNRAPEYKAYILSELVKNVWPKIESGEIRPLIYRVLPIAQAAEAHAILERGENIGKVVLRVDDEA